MYYRRIYIAISLDDTLHYRYQYIYLYILLYKTGSGEAFESAKRPRSFGRRMRDKGGFAP